MRIGMMADLYKPHISGVTNYIALNKLHLEAAGHQVYVFTFGDEGFQDDEQNVIRSPGLPILDTGFYLSLRYNREARKLLYTMDVAHVHHPFVSGSLARLYCRPRGIPIIFTNHTRYDLYAQAYLPGMPEIIGDTALQVYLPAFCRSCNLVIAPSPGMQEVLLRFGVDTPIQVVPNGVDLEPFGEPPEPMNRDEIGFGTEDVVLVYVGRLGPEKNLPFLLRSFAGIAQAYEHVRLLLIGDGPERDNLKDQVKNAGIEALVHFVGAVPYSRIPSYLAMAEAFVTASFTEVHPLSVIEAMAAGLPVLGMQSPGVGDTIQDGITGFLAQKDDLAGFTAKMVRMVIDQEGRRKMGIQARIAAQDYSIERTTQAMLECYQRVINQTAGQKHSLRARLRRWTDGIRG